MNLKKANSNTKLIGQELAFCYAASMVTLRSFDKSISSAILYLYSASAAAFGAILLAATSVEFSPIQ